MKEVSRVKRRQFWNFFLTTLCQMRQLLKVHPEDFDVKTLLAAAREGRLYIEETDIEAARRRQLEHCQSEAMNYVSSIDEYVAPEWKPYIKELWTTILNDALFTPQLMLQKGRNQGQLNKYLITIIVDCLRAMRIYQCENLLELHKKMEGVDKKNSIYKSAGMYSLCWEQKQRFHDLVKSFKKV